MSKPDSNVRFSWRVSWDRRPVPPTLETALAATGRITMTTRELDRFRVIQDVADGTLKPWRAAPRLGLTAASPALVGRLPDPDHGTGSGMRGSAAYVGWGIDLPSVTRSFKRARCEGFLELSQLHTFSFLNRAAT
jgi:hypothetical protein